MGAGSLFIVAVSLVQLSLGEPSYRQYRILSGNYYDYPYDRSVYYNPYADYRYRYTAPAAVRYTQSPVVRYTEPVRSYSAARDDNVYITDMYGRTTVQNAAHYQSQQQYRAAESRQYSNYVTRYSAQAPSTTCTSGTCGLNAQCSMVGGRPVCSCFRGYMGDPLNTCRRAECLDNSECRGHQHCKNEHCVDPCAEICGTNAHCETRNHVPVCSCPAGFTGDPFTHCRHFDPAELCHPSPCGPNTNCEVVNGVPTCKCLAGYHGSPIAGCRHECETSSECGSHLACIEFKCQNPCHTQCGTNAECDGVRNNAAICKCPRGYYGSPYTACQAECTTHSDCPRSKPACFYNSCKNPCDGVCGIGANCELRDITPVCSCPRDMTGDPFVRCRPFEKRDLCEPNPCGVNAQCQPGYDKYNEERPVCTCLPGYQGDPIKGCVRGECTEDSHCPDNQACNNYHCTNPCIGQCGSNAECMPRRHLAVCTCPSGYNGDALINCYQITGTSITRRYYRHVMELEEQEQAELKSLEEQRKRMEEAIVAAENITKQEKEQETQSDDKNTKSKLKKADGEVKKAEKGVKKSEDVKNVGDVEKKNEQVDEVEEPAQVVETTEKH